MPTVTWSERERERERVAEVEMPQKPFKCSVAGSLVLLIMEKINIDFFLNTILESQWPKCLQIMSSQCLETQTVIYRSIFVVFPKVSFHNTRLPLSLVS